MADTSSKTHRGIVQRLYPTQAQAEQFAQFAGVCRLVYNLALEQREQHWRQFLRATGKHISYPSQARELTALRADFDWVAAIHVTPLQQALRDLDTAYQRFFKGLGGYPTFRKRGHNTSFRFSGREVLVEKLNAKWARVRLPKIGWVKFRATRPLEGRTLNATVMLTALGWHVSFCQEVDDTRVTGSEPVGIDRGVTVPLMLSDGTSYNLPASVSDLDGRIRKAQRVASRRKRGSVRHAKAQRRVAALRAKQARIRKHWAHEATTQIARRHGTVVIERLRTKNMTASASGTIAEPGRNVAQKRGLNRAILNVGWHQIETMLTYKARDLIRVDPRHTSQTCASCGTVDSRSRKNQSQFCCTACGHRDNADRNAAINILRRNTASMIVEEGHRLSVEAITAKGVDPLGNLRPSGRRRC